MTGLDALAARLAARRPELVEAARAIAAACPGLAVPERESMEEAR